MGAKMCRKMKHSKMFVDSNSTVYTLQLCNVTFKVLSKTETFDEDMCKILELLEVEDINITIYGMFNPN